MLFTTIALFLSPILADRKQKKTMAVLVLLDKSTAHITQGKVMVSLLLLDLRYEVS